MGVIRYCMSALRVCILWHKKQFCFGEMYLSFFFSILKDTTDRNDMEVDSILKQSLWLNPFLKIGGKLCIKPKFSPNAIIFINDLISKPNSFYSDGEFKREYNVNVNFLEYYGIIDAIPGRWITLIGNCNKVPNIEDKVIDFIKTNAKICRYIYKIYLERKKDDKINSQQKMGK